MKDMEVVWKIYKTF